MHALWKRFSDRLPRRFGSALALGLHWSLVCASASATAGSHWPQFRGASASGVDSSVPLPTTWDVEAGRNVLWTASLPGLSHSSPIVWGNRVYVTLATRPGTPELKVGLYGDIASADDQGIHEWRLRALDLRRGTVLWDVPGPTGVPRVQRHTKASHCNSTPATDGRHIAAIFGSEGLYCFDRSGRRLWHQDLGPMDAGFFAVPSAQWGFASSPVIHRDQVIVLCDVQTNSFIASFDVKTGRQRWRTARNDVPTWGTPTVVESPGRRQIVVNGWHHTGGYDFATGGELWRLDEGGDIPVPTPIFAHGLILQTSAHGRFRPMRAIRPEAAGTITPPDPGQTNSAIAWAHARQGNYMQTPIVVGDFLWGCADNGVLTCFEARTGAIRYSERLPSAQGYTASPVSDGRHLYFASEIGNVYVVPAQPTFSVVATNIMGQTCMASPAIGGGKLLIRTRDQLIALAQ